VLRKKISKMIPWQRKKNALVLSEVSQLEASVQVEGMVAVLEAAEEHQLLQKALHMPC
jgi:hypothetical protein